MIFDDIACEKQDSVRAFFCMGRHKKVDCFYLCHYLILRILVFVRNGFLLTSVCQWKKFIISRSIGSNDDFTIPISTWLNLSKVFLNNVCVQAYFSTRLNLKKVFLNDVCMQVYFKQVNLSSLIVTRIANSQASVLTLFTRFSMDS